MGLTLTDISYRYPVASGPTSAPALDGVSLTVEPGELVLLLGATGSGKSTLLRIAAGLLGTTQGSATIDGEQLTGRSARGAVGLVFQDAETQLFAETIAHDVAFGPRNLGETALDAEEAARDALARVGLDPDVYGSRSPFGLSGGEARRAAIAGVLAMRPRYLLLDEPTAGLDARGREAVRALIGAERVRSGVVVVSHSPAEFLGDADRVLLLADGRTSFEGSASQLVADPAAFDRAGLAAPDVLRVQQLALERGARLPAAYTLDPEQAARALTEAGGVESVSVPVPFGQYVPGDSPVHRLDPRAKLALTFAYTLVLFSAHGWPGMALGAGVVLAAIAVSRVPWRIVARGLVPIAWLLVFTLAVNALVWRPESALIVIGPIGVSASGLSRGLFFASRIVLLILGTSLVTLTTSPVELTDAMARLMRPLRVVRVPVDDVAMMFSIALRFIPTTAEEAEKIIVAQTARGAVFDEGGLVARARAWLPVLVPLFVNLFRRADDLAIAMESRCYSGQGRTHLHQPIMRTTDWVTLGVGVTAALAAVILLP